MKSSSDSARAITTELLNRSGRAFVNGDFDAFLSCISLPYRLETFDGKRLVETEDQLRDVFEAVRMHHRKTSVTEMNRHVVEALFRDQDTILATFETRLLHKNILTQAPYPVFAVIVRENGAWKTNNMTVAVEDSAAHNALLMGRNDRSV